MSPDILILWPEFWISLTPLAPTNLHSGLLLGFPSSTQCLSMGLCICCHQLLDEASLMATGLGTDLWVQQSFIRNHFIDFWGGVSHICFLSYVFGLPSLWFLTIQVVPGMGSLLFEWASSWICHWMATPTTFTPAPSGGRTNCRSRVLWLVWCPNPITGNQPMF